MKTFWRRIFYVVIIVNLLVGITLAIIHTVQSSSFPVFLNEFMGTILTTAFGTLIMEHFHNVEKGIDSANRRAEGLPPLPDAAYSSVPAFVRSAVANQQQNMGGQMQNPAPNRMPNPMPNQAPNPMPNPAPNPMPNPAPNPMPNPQPGVPTPSNGGDAWTCSCGAVNVGAAKFCKTCGKPRQ